MTAADRPSVTDDARAEALRRWTNPPGVNADTQWGLREGFVAGAEWAAGRAETTTEPHPCLPSLGEPCGNCHRCTDPAETTTATTEDKSVIERAATVITANTDEPMWSAVVIAKEMASRGLLATARTHPTEPTDAQVKRAAAALMDGDPEYENGTYSPDDYEVMARVALRAAWTEADR